MTAQTSTRIMRDDTGDWVFEQTNTGIAELGSGFTATKFEVRGGISLQVTPMTVDRWDYCQIMLGIQYGPSGYTPITMTLGSAIDISQWVFVETLPSMGALPTWSDETLTGGRMNNMNVDRTDFRQLLVPGSGYDFYLSVASNVTIDFLTGYRAYLTARMWFE